MGFEGVNSMNCTLNPPLSITYILMFIVLYAHCVNANPERGIFLGV